MSGRTFFLFLFDAPGKVTEPLTNRKEKRMETQTEPEVLDALRNKLATVRKERSREKLFRLVRILDEEGSYGTLMELLPELAVFPAAYLSAGRTKIRHGGRISETPVELFVIDRFSDDTGRDVESFRTLKTVNQSISFKPVEYRQSLGKVRYHLQDIENETLDV
mgnify:CR=1 FL=1